LATVAAGDVIPEMTDDGRQAWLAIAPLKLVS
jgi:hypothetical protein